MKQLKKWVPERSALLYAGILLYTLERCWNASLILPYHAGVDEVLKYAFALMMVLVIARQEFTPKLYLIYGLAAVGAVMIRLRTGFMIDAFTILIILACREADLISVSRVIRKTTTVFLIVHMAYFFILLLLGQQELFYTDGVGRVRAGFGLLGPNLLSSYFFNLVLMWAWETYDSIRLRQLFWIVVIATVLYKFTDSRTAYLYTLALCVMLPIIRHCAPAAKLTNAVSAVIAPGLALLVLVFSYHRTEGLAAVLNKLLSGRLNLTAYGIDNFGFTLLGQRVNYEFLQDPSPWFIYNAPRFTFDCVYSYLWSNIGILWLVLICLCFIALARRGNPRICLLLIFWALYGMSEITVMSIVRFFPLALISTLFLSREESDRLYGPKKPAAPGQEP